MWNSDKPRGNQIIVHTITSFKEIRWFKESKTDSRLAYPTGVWNSIGKIMSQLIWPCNRLCTTVLILIQPIQWRPKGWVNYFIQIHSFLASSYNIISKIMAIDPPKRWQCFSVLTLRWAKEYEAPLHVNIIHSLSPTCRQ